MFSEYVQHVSLLRWKVDYNKMYKKIKSTYEFQSNSCLDIFSS